MAKYYTLLAREDVKSKWTIEFGDYDKETVEAEKDDYVDSAGRKRSNLKIVKTSDARQSTIRAAVAALNAKVPA